MHCKGCELRERSSSLGGGCRSRGPGRSLAALSEPSPAPPRSSSWRRAAASATSLHVVLLLPQLNFQSLLCTLPGARRANEL